MRSGCAAIGGMSAELPPRIDPTGSGLRDALAATGLAAPVVEALVALDTANFQFARRVMKGELPATLIAEIAPGLEIGQFYALSAIARIESGRGQAQPQAPTVGLLAAELMVDPSRASRIAADLVERGLIARAVSQQDGRRSVLEPTAEGRALLQAFVAAKWRRMLRIFADWSAADIEAFARLFERYSEGMRQEYPGPPGGSSAG